MKTTLKPETAVHSTVLFGEEDVTRLAASWLETHLNINEDDETVNWKTEIGAARKAMRAALKRAGMYSPNAAGEPRPPRDNH
jgi:hypothetical protein